MKTLILTVLTAVLTMGCTQAKYALMTSVDIARIECSKIGYTVGSQQYMQCVERTANNIRNNR